MGEKVRKLVHDKFKQRSHTHKWSKEKFVITAVRRTAPATYFLSNNGSKAFYSQDLLSEGQEEERPNNEAPLILLSGILKKKTLPTQFLRSGAARAFDDVYLVTLPNKKRRFMNRSQILDFPNGAELLDAFLSK